MSRAKRKKNNIEISRTDFRNGMPDEVLATVSDKVYQTKNEADFAEKMEELLVSYRGRKIYNPSLGREVEIRSSSIGKVQEFYGEMTIKNCWFHICPCCWERRFYEYGKNI